MKLTEAQAVRLRHTGAMGALAGMTAVVSTGCTAEEINTLLTILRIIGIFV